MVEDRLGAVERRLFDDRDQTVDADGLVDRLVEKLRAFASDPGGAGMRIEHDGIAGCEHVDDVPGQRRQRMRDRRDRPDDAEGGVLVQGDAVATAEGIGTQRLDARHALGTDYELVDLVFQPADLGLFQLLTTQLLRLVFANAANAIDSFPALVEIARFELLLRLAGRGHGIINILKQAPITLTRR